MAGVSVAQHDLCEPGGLRERKKAATRRALGIAAMRLAVQRGLDNVLVEDIAAEAGVSTRTFNNYFASKYEAICALAMERGRLIGVALQDRPAREPLMEAITSAVLAPYAGSERTPDKEWIEGVRLVVRSPALQGEYLRTQYAAQQTLARAIADRVGADLEADMFPAVMAGAVAAAMQVALERWLRSEPPVALVPLLRAALGELRWPLATREHAEGEFACDPPARPLKLAQAARQPPAPTAPAPTTPPPTAPPPTPSEYPC
jgi:AcrR family transcriptional regulator